MTSPRRSLSFIQFVNEANTSASTDFEIYLVNALNTVNGHSAQVVNGYTNKKFSAPAETIARAMKKTGKYSGVAAKCPTASSLSPLYLKYGVSSRTPKTDLLIGPVRASLKNAKGSQITTAEANEASAVWAAAFHDDTTAKKLVETYILPLIKDTLSKEVFYTLRNKFNPKKPGDFEKAMTRLLLAKDLPAATEEWAVVLEFLESVGLKVPKIKSTLRDFLDTPETKEKLFYEFASGARRFPGDNNAKESPTEILSWGIDGSYTTAPIRDYVSSHMGCFRYGIRDRGARRGGSLRIGLGGGGGTCVEQRQVGEYPMSAPIRLESAYAEFAAHITGMEIEYLAEGFASWATTAGQWARDLWNTFTQVIMVVVKWIIATVQQGIVELISFFNYEPLELSWQH